MSDSPYTFRIVSIVIPVHNGEATIERCVRSVLAQELGPGWRAEIVVVDDGSQDRTAEIVEQFDPDGVRLIRHGRNRGRSSSLNTGVGHALGETVVVMDSDLRYVSPDCIQLFIDTIASGVDIAVGSLRAEGESFWPQYETLVYLRRENRVEAGELMSATTAHVAFRASTLARIGGFNTQYKHYGFEDRDLYAKMVASNVRFRFVPHAVATHTSGNSMSIVARKFREAGRYSATIFRRAFPLDYRKGPYAQFDIREKACWHRGGYALLAHCSRPAANIVEWILPKRYVPFWIKCRLVQASSALCYLAGTLEATRSVAADDQRDA